MEEIRSATPVPWAQGQEPAKSEPHAPNRPAKNEHDVDTDKASAEAEAAYRADHDEDEQLLLLEQQQMMMLMLESLSDANAEHATLSAGPLVSPGRSPSSSTCRPESAETLLGMPGSPKPAQGIPLAGLPCDETGREKSEEEEEKRTIEEENEEDELDEAELQAMLEEQKLMFEEQEKLTKMLMEQGLEIEMQEDVHDDAELEALMREQVLEVRRRAHVLESSRQQGAQSLATQTHARRLTRTNPPKHQIMRIVAPR